MDLELLSPKKNLSTYTPPADTTQLIRTYAKDVAALTNTPIPQQAASSPLPTQNATLESDGVVTAAFDPSPVNRGGDPSSPKEFKSEVMDLTEEDSNDIFKGKETPRSVPLMQQATVSINPIVAPIGNAENQFYKPSKEIITPVAVPEELAPLDSVQELTPAVAEPDQERENILARLREKVAKRKEEETAQPVSKVVPEAVAPSILPENPAPLAPNPFARPVSDSSPIIPDSSPLHTFSSDFSDRIDREQSSTFSVLAAQSDAGQTPPSSRAAPARKSILPLVAGVVMLLLGSAAVAGAYFYTHQNQTTPTVTSVPSLIPFDESVAVPGVGQALMQSIAKVAAGTSITGNVIVTYITAPVTSGIIVAGTPEPGGALIRQLALQAPDILLRNIDESSTVGVIRAGSDSKPFFILKVNSYERTFAGMLAWEPQMANDLAILYPAYPDSSPAPTSTSSPLVAQANTSAFIDATVDNHDVRELKDTSGRTILLYGYEGKSILLIARDEDAFKALVSRVQAQGK